MARLRSVIYPVVICYLTGQRTAAAAAASCAPSNPWLLLLLLLLLIGAVACQGFPLLLQQRRCIKPLAAPILLLQERC